MLKERVSLFTKKRDFFFFILACGIVLSYSLLIEFNNYKNLTRFDSNLLTATVLRQYTKTKDEKTYQVLKLKSEEGFSFFTSAKENFQQVKDKRLKLEIWAAKISFYEYLNGFYAYTKVLGIQTDETLKQRLNNHIASSHANEDIANIYQALYTAQPLHTHLQAAFSALGVSHLLAISGFHLGVLSGVLFFLLRVPYKFFQDRYFPYRSYTLDSFMLISFVLLCYLLFLDSPPSLLRAFAMLLIGFFLYERGIKIVSMQTLFLTVVLLLSFFPRLVFSLGFWLSAGGVFYIFLFLMYFKDLNKVWQFVLMPFWVYLLMLPFSLSIFGGFSLYHPLSIVWTTLFSLFYPLSIFLHLAGFGDSFDTLLEMFLSFAEFSGFVRLQQIWLFVHIALSFLAIPQIFSVSLKEIWKSPFLALLLFYSSSLFIYAVYNVA
ncbi:ComEC/Rec2 family competence protein [bacterium]|nr:ComEC/Rec2 family competence protein [bacterium]